MLCIKKREAVVIRLFWQEKVKFVTLLDTNLFDFLFPLKVYP